MRAAEREIADLERQIEEHQARAVQCRRAIAEQEAKATEAERAIEWLRLAKLTLEGHRAQDTAWALRERRRKTGFVSVSHAQRHPWAAEVLWPDEVERFIRRGPIRL